VSKEPQPVGLYDFRDW